MGSVQERSNSDHSPLAISILSGAVIAALGFILVIMAVGWFSTRFDHFADSPWAKLLLPAAILLMVAGGVLRSMRSRQRQR